MGLTIKQILLMCGMLITGTINTISKKVQLDCEAPGYPNKTANNTAINHPFNKPWFQSLIMFAGETFCFFGYLIIRMRARKANQMSPYQQIGESHDIITTAVSWEAIPIFSLVFLLPATCDVFGTSVAGIGLLYIDASIWQMMRGCIIIFAGILSMIFLKRRLHCFNWTGMVVVVLGLALVGLASVFKKNKQHDSTEAILGIGLVLLGGLASSAQMVVEEVFVKRRGFHPLHVVGMEGLFGTVVMAFIILPALYYIPGSDVNGSHENVIDALYQITQNALLFANVVLYMLSIAFYNYFGLAVTRSLTAVHRTLIDALRTVLIWVVDLVLYYGIDNKFGEPFDKLFGLLQIDGFAFLVIGTLIYNRVMDLTFIPCCAIEEEQEESVSSTSPEDIQGYQRQSVDDQDVPSRFHQPPPVLSVQSNDEVVDFR